MKTIARVYDTYGQARAVVGDLEDAGIATADINLIANRITCEETLENKGASGAGAGVGAAFGGAAGLLAGLGVLAIPGLGPVVAQLYCEAVRRGGTMVSVRFPDDREPRMREIMTRHRPIDEATRLADYRNGGWTHFDPAADPYVPTNDELKRLRGLYSGRLMD